MNDTVDVKAVCQLLSDDEIRARVDRELLRMTRPVKSMVLTWTKNRTEYMLEIVLTGETADVPRPPERRSVEVGRVGNIEYNALNKLSMEGRRLYFRLRKDFPMLRRKLSAYKYLRM